MRQVTRYGCYGRDWKRHCQQVEAPPPPPTLTPSPPPPPALPPPRAAFPAPPPLCSLNPLNQPKSSFSDWPELSSSPAHTADRCIHVPNCFQLKPAHPPPPPIPRGSVPSIHSQVTETLNHSAMSEIQPSQMRGLKTVKTQTQLSLSFLRYSLSERKCKK